MPVIRLILLLVVLGGLTLLLWQNWSPVLPLVFLGVKTQALPLAIWILFSLTAGIFTSLLITALFNVSNYFVRATRSPRRSVKATPKATPPPSQPPQKPVSSTPPKQNTDPTPNYDSNDWSSDTSFDDDWNFEKEPAPNQNSGFETTVQDSTNYEVSQSPKSSSQSGSYSYSYRQPSNSSVGKTEAIYDANYRVIKPPYQKTDPTPSDDDDWGFDDDDEPEDTKR